MKVVVVYRLGASQAASISLLPAEAAELVSPALAEVSLHFLARPVLSVPPPHRPVWFFAIVPTRLFESDGQLL